MTVAVVVPGYDLDGARARNFVRVHAHLLHGLKGVSVRRVEGASPAAARNLGARAEAHADVLVFNDADTLVPAGQIRAAIDAALGGALAFAFTEYRRLGPEETAAVLDGADPWEAQAYVTYIEPPSHGCVAVSRELFEAVGGYDERLEAYEDDAFNIRARVARYNVIRRVHGVAVHLWHPRLGDPGDDAWDERYAASKQVWMAEYQ